MERRIGRFYVNPELVHEATEKAAFLLGSIDFVPLRVEFLGYMNLFEYVGYSPLFEVCEMHAIPQSYNMIITTDGGKNGGENSCLKSILAHFSDLDAGIKPLGQGNDWREFDIPAEYLLNA